MPRTPETSLCSDTLTEWGPLGEHFLWGSYDITPRPRWWQRLIGEPTSVSFQLRLSDLSNALDPGDRHRLARAERKLRGAAERWSRSLCSPGEDSWFNEDLSVQVSCYYTQERVYSHLGYRLEGRADLKQCTEELLHRASVLIAAGAPADHAEASEEARAFAGARHGLSGDVVARFEALVTELVSIGEQVRAEEVSRIFENYGSRTSGR